MERKQTIREIILAVFLGFFIALLGIFYVRKLVNHPSYQHRDYPEIIKDGTLRATIEYNSMNLYADKDTISGYNYELLEAFGKEKGLKIALSPEMSMKKRLDGLYTGKFDLLASGTAATSELKDSILFTDPLFLDRLVLVQRKLQGNSKLDSSRFIRSQIMLAGRTLNVVAGSPAILRIRNLSQEIGDTIYVKEIDKYGQEQLISLVAHGDIDYAVCDERIAKIAADSIPEIDVQTAIGFTQFLSWGVNKHSPILRDSLNAWLKRYKKTQAYQSLSRKYL